MLAIPNRAVDRIAGTSGTRHSRQEAWPHRAHQQNPEPAPFPHTSLAPPTAEEIVLHLAIHDGPGWEEEKDDIEDEAHEALPRHSRDYDWDMCSEMLFQDHDILMLYDESLDGIENPGDDANRYLTMGDLRPAAWFEYFANVEPRDPTRGFRR